MTIRSFTGDHAFLSNFYPAEIKYEGLTYKTSEHLFVAMKTLDLDERKVVSEIETPGQAKRYGRKSITLREDWNKIRVDIMRFVVYQKFEQNPELKQKLLDTGHNLLVEGNNWGDMFWGQVDGEGSNFLGRILMALRLQYHMSAFIGVK